MPGYLLLWNAKEPASWADVKKDLRKMQTTGHFRSNWTCGSRKSIPRGSRVFLKRTRSSVRGLVASGYTVGDVFEDGHWGDKPGTAHYVPVEFDALIDPFSDDLLPQELLPLGDGDFSWDKQGGGERIPDDVLGAVEAVWRAHLRGQGLKVPAPRKRVAPERSVTLARRLSRDTRFSRDVRAASRGRCAVCPPNLVYGPVGILEAAHIRSVEADGPDERANGLPLCPNHHALFDGGYWTLSPRNHVLVAKGLSRELAATFNPLLNLAWTPDPKQVRWHRTTVFRG